VVTAYWEPWADSVWELAGAATGLAMRIQARYRAKTNLSLRAGEMQAKVVTAYRNRWAGAWEGNPHSNIANLILSGTNPKHEARNPKQIANSKFKTARPSRQPFHDFGFWICLGCRYSDFKFPADEG
jgi:hypothetical protein